MQRSEPLFNAAGRKHVESLLVHSAADYEQLLGEVMDVLRKSGDEPFVFATISSALASRGLNFAIVMGARALLEAARERLEPVGLNGLN